MSKQLSLLAILRAGTGQLLLPLCVLPVPYRSGGHPVVFRDLASIHVTVLAEHSIHTTMLSLKGDQLLH